MDRQPQDDAMLSGAPDNCTDGLEKKPKGELIKFPRSIPMEPSEIEVSSDDIKCPSDDKAEIEHKDVMEDKAALRGRILNLAVPALIEQALMTLVSMADMIMVGRLGPWAITSVGLANQPMMMAMSVFIALNVGATALVARFVGAREPKEASKVARQSLMLATIMGFVLMAVGIISAGEILHFMGAEHDTIGPGTEYLRAVSMGLPMWAISISLTAALRGAGDTRTPMTVNIIGNLVNVVGNYLLIYGHFGFPRLGVMGAGVATAFSRMVACGVMLYKVGSGGKIIKITKNDSFKLDFGIIKRVLNVGIPAALEQLIMRGGQMTFARIVSSFGTITYAAHQIALNIEGFTFAPGFSFSIASTTLVGQYLGAKEPDNSEKVGWEIAKIGALIGIGTGILYFFFGKYFAYLYTDDQTVLSLSAGVLRVIALVQPFMMTNFILIGGLRGAGDTRWTLYITVAGFWGLRVLTAYLLAVKMGFGLYGAWVGMALDMVGRSVLAALRFKAGGWKHIRV